MGYGKLNPYQPTLRRVTPQERKRRKQAAKKKRENPDGVGKDEKSPQNFSDPIFRSDCTDFIDQLILRVANEENLAGVGRGMALWARDELAPKAAKGELGFFGFQDKYIDGGQNGFALVHIAGMAGVTLVGHAPLIPILGSETGYQRSYAQYNEDHRELLRGLDLKAQGRSTIDYARNPNYPLDMYIAEKHAELWDDGAGVAVGHILEKIHREEEGGYEKMRRLLCK